jgi:hypothetical protein
LANVLWVFDEQLCYKGLKIVNLVVKLLSMKTKAFLLPFVLIFASLKTFAQYQGVNFLPLPIDETIKAKHYYTNGVMFQVESASFKNDTNYFTIYIINNSDKPLPLVTIEGNTIANITLYSIPKNFIPYAPLLSLNKQGITCGNSYVTRQLMPGNYIKETMALACVGSTQQHKQRVRFTLESQANPEEGVDDSYFSNAFDVYYNQQTQQNTDSVATKYKVPKVTIGGHISTNIRVDSLVKLSPEVVLIHEYGAPADEFVVLSSTIIIVPKQEGKILVSSVAGNEIISDIVNIIKSLQPGDRLIIDSIKVTRRKTDNLYLAPVVYTVTE